jgi:hypothetical protein
VITSRCARPTRPGQPTRGVKCGWVRVATFNCQTVLPLPRARRRTVKTVRAVRTPRHRHHLPGITNFQSARYAEIGRDRLCTRLSSVVREFPLCARDPPRLSSIPRGSVEARCRSQYLKVRRCCRSLELAFDHETVRRATTPRHCHHPPGIKNSRSDSYAEIDTDSLRTRLRTLCASLRQVQHIFHGAHLVAPLQ